MTSKLKCPFCGEKLYSSDNCYVCLNDGCIFCGFHFMEKRWKPIIELKQSLIQAKQDLEIATKALEDIKNDALTKNRYHIIADINYALEQITHDNSEKPNSHEHKE